MQRRKNAIACQDAMAAANSVALEALSCVRTVIGFAAEDFEHSKYSEKIQNHYLLNIRQVRVWITALLNRVSLSI